MRPASLFSVALGLAMISSVIGAEPAAPAPIPASGGADADAVAVLDGNSLWRHFLVSRCAYVRGTDGNLRPMDLTPLTGRQHTWPTVDPRPAASTAPSPLPPPDWAGLAMDDSAWPRVRLPQPAPTNPHGGFGHRPQAREGGTAVLLVRGKFEIKDPSQVKACTLSLDYWGGVVVYVNGKEAVRRHVLSGKREPSPVAGTARRVLRTTGDGPLLPDGPDLLALAEDYPMEAFTTPDGKPNKLLGFEDTKFVRDPALREKLAERLALRERNVRDARIPAALLRPGVNVLAIEVHTAPNHNLVGLNFGADGTGRIWPPIGLLSARLTVSPAGAAVANVARPRGLRLWNCAACDTVTTFDYGDPWESLRPIVIRAARNSVFSGRLMVGSDGPLKGLKVSVTDLSATAGGAKIAASAVHVRYAAAAEPGRSWISPHRFDGLLDAIPAEIPIVQAPPLPEKFDHGPVDRKTLVPGAVAPLWFTVRVPKDAKPGVYESQVSVAAEGLPPTSVPLRVSVCDWIMPDPKDFRMHNLAYHSDDAVARHYEVPLWSDKHFELMGKSHALMAEAGSRQVYVNLSGHAIPLLPDAELILWTKQPDGSAKPDFTIFDRYLDMVAKSVGKPLPLRLNIWGETRWGGKPRDVSVPLLDPATGTIERLQQPGFGTAEAVAFWRPVFDEILKKLKARGWLEVTALGWIAGQDGPTEDVSTLAQKLWPDGVWACVAHNMNRNWKVASNPWVKVRYADTCYFYGFPSVRGYRELLKPQAEIFCNTYRFCWNANSLLTNCRRVGEDIVMSGRDGVSDFGVDLFPFKNPRRGYSGVPSVEYPSGPMFTFSAMLYPGPDGPVATERFEMFREGVELAEALLFIERALERTRLCDALLFIERGMDPPAPLFQRTLQEKKLSPDLQQRAERYLEARSQAFIMNWFGLRDMPGVDEDGKLLDLAAEVARELRK